MEGRRMLQRSRFQMLDLKTITERRSTMTDWSLQATACSAAVLASLFVHIWRMMLMFLDLADEARRQDDAGYSLIIQ